MTVSGARGLPLEALQPYLVELPPPRCAAPPPPGPPLDWRELFGNGQPVEIEVGSGKGLFLLNQSRARPQVNFLGIEIERKYVLHTAARLAKAHSANVRLTCSDARWLLQTRLADGSVTAVHVYFPDPWWKNRHRKRRLFTAEFVAQVARILMRGGRLHFASDVRDYFEASLELVTQQPNLRPIDGAWAEADDLTNFERKYRREGRPIYRALYELFSPGP